MMESIFPVSLPMATFLALSLATSAAARQTPEVVDPRFRLELFAADPDIVTPIGATFDRQGRLLVIESHTHQRAEDYQGPPTDRIRIVEDTDGDGRADGFHTFYEGTEATMSLARGPDDWVYVATRMKVFRIRDTDGDDRADQEQLVVHLETGGNYPHNGLSGLALDDQGHLWFGMGENLGADYRLIGRDGSWQRGSGEGGIFRCDLDGSRLVRIATGFWNPFGICIDPVGRVFAVGNDADERPPCRLVQVFETGDYGFQYRYGRSGRHPLQAWDGELPGTLPMLAGTGEAPCEVTAYRGGLWVNVWGDNRIERYRLIPNGASFHARREIVVQGDDDFRPVAFAESPDGTLYVTDWVDPSYPVHGKGRIWRISCLDSGPAETMPPLSEPERQARRAAASFDPAMLASDDVFLRQAAVAGWARSPRLRDQHLELIADARVRLGWLQALRWSGDHARGDPLPPPLATLKQALADADRNVRLFAVRWVADARLNPLRNDIEHQLTGFQDCTPELFLASIATLEWLETGQTTFDPARSVHYLVQTATDPRQPAGLRGAGAADDPARRCRHQR